MARTGANPDDLDMLARSFERVAAALTAGMSTTRAALDEVWWRGPDAQRFQAELSEGQRNTGRISESLRAASQQLGREAQEQRAASSAGGSVGPGGSASTARGGATVPQLPNHLVAALRDSQLDPRATSAETASMSSLLTQMGIGLDGGKAFLDVDQANRWLDLGPATLGAVGSALGSGGLARLPSRQLASALLGEAIVGDGWSGQRAAQMTGQLSRSMALGLERRFEHAGELGFASYDARLRAFLGGRGTVSGQFSAGLDGIAAAGAAEAFIGAEAAGALGVGLGGVDASLTGQATAGARAAAAGRAAVGLDRIDLDGSVSAFAGAAASYGATIGGRGASVGLGGGVRAGVGFDVGGDVDLGMDRVGFEVDLGAALGTGLDLELGLGFSPNKTVGAIGGVGTGAAKAAGSVVKGIGKIGGLW